MEGYALRAMLAKRIKLAARSIPNTLSRRIDRTLDPTVSLAVVLTNLT
jgi:hypothetical protein